MGRVNGWEVQETRRRALLLLSPSGPVPDLPVLGVLKMPNQAVVWCGRGGATTKISVSATPHTLWS